MMRRIDDHQKKILKGRVIVALHETLGRRPTPSEIESHYRLALILHATLMPYAVRHKEPAKTSAHSLF